MRISDWSSDVCSSDLHVKGITKAADAAVAAAGRASDRLTEQMKTLADATAAIDAQITDARAERAEAEQNSFARRAALLIEALNSNSIDIAQTLSNELSNSAWAAYLKAARGVLTPPTLPPPAPPPSRATR